jgi:membrane fusion protein YbhG
MSKKTIIIIGIFILLIITAVGIALVFDDKNNKNGLTLYGNVDIRQVDLGFRVFGRVKCLYFEEGDFVRKGQIMAELDQVPYLEQVSESRALKNSIEARLENAKAKLAKREQAIASFAISKEDFDDSFFNVNELKASLNEAKAALDRNITNYNDTYLCSPTDGIVLTRIKEPGSIVNTQDAVYSLNICNPMWIRTYVTEPQLGEIFFGQKALIYTDTEDLPVYHGHIGFISPVAEFTPKNVETTELRVDLVYRLRIIVDNPDKMLKQGMPVTVKLINKNLNSNKSYSKHQCH